MVVFRKRIFVIESQAQVAAFFTEYPFYLKERVTNYKLPDLGTGQFLENEPSETSALRKLTVLLLIIKFNL